MMLLLPALLVGATPVLPEPYATKSVRNFSKVIEWPAGKMPQAPGFVVTRIAADLVSPRNLYVAPNGDIFVAEANTEMHGLKKIGAALVGYTKSQRTEASANRITVLRDTNHDGAPDEHRIFLANLVQPFGMAIVGDYFYVGQMNALWRYPYKSGDLHSYKPGEKLLDLPVGGYNNHWTRNLLASKDGKKIYISVGSGSNVGEHGAENEVRRANILEVNLDGSGERIYASGLRNPCGIAWQGDTLWTAVNERDELGDDLVPDYLTSVTPGGFYGWPYSYFGAHLDPRVKPQRPDLVDKAIVPDVPLGAHTASLGLAFYEGTMLPAKYHHGAFIGQHGSWNRSQLAGYQVVFVPFKDGRPSGAPEEFLGGFIANRDKQEVYGRPVGVAVAADGALLVADDVSNVIWRVAVK